MIAAALLALFAVSVLFAGRELGRQTPRPTSLMCWISIMIILAVFAGGALTGVEV